MRNPAFFSMAVVLILLVIICFSGCLTQNGGVSDNITCTIKTPDSSIPDTSKAQTVSDTTYNQEHISQEVRTRIMENIPSIPYIYMNEYEAERCLRSDTRSLVMIVLNDPNAQDMIMRDGHIQGIGLYTPHSAKTNPDSDSCTVAVYIQSSNITSAFVIDQEKQIVSQQVIEVPSGTHATDAGNWTLISRNGSVVLAFRKVSDYLE